MFGSAQLPTPFGNRGRLYAAGLALALAALTSPVKLGVVSGTSMAPTFQSGAVYLLDRTHYRSHPVQRGDVVVFEHNGARYIKRVVALEGDTLYVIKQRGDDGEELIRPEQLPGIRRLAASGPWRQAYKIVNRRVPVGSCYVVGDHADESVDSRAFGFVPLEKIQGRVVSAPPADQPTPAGVYLAHNHLSPAP